MGKGRKCNCIHIELATDSITCHRSPCQKCQESSFPTAHGHNKEYYCKTKKVPQLFHRQTLKEKATKSSINFFFSLPDAIFKLFSHSLHCESLCSIPISQNFFNTLSPKVNLQPLKWVSFTLIEAAFTFLCFP